MAKGNQVAIQNFSGGGFYGKLGGVVGQRYKGGYTLRERVKPYQPNSPAQIAARGRLAIYSKLAAFSNNLNRGTPCIDISALPNNAARGKIAFANIKAGASELNQIPLFDSEHYPPFIATAIQFNRYENDTVILFVQGVLPSVSRSISVVTNWASAPASFCEWNVTSGIFEPTEAGGVLRVQNPFGEVWEENSQICFISNDDAEHESQNFWLPESPLVYQKPEEREFNFEILSFTRENRTFTLVFAEDYFSGVQNFQSVSIRCVVAGEWGNFSIQNPSFQNKDGKFSFQFSAPGTDEPSLWAFPVGASVSFESFKISSQSLIVYAENKTISVQNSNDLIRNLPDVFITNQTFSLSGTFQPDIYINVPRGLLPANQNEEFSINQTIIDSSSDSWFVVASDNERFEILPGSFENSQVYFYKDSSYIDESGILYFKLNTEYYLEVDDFEGWENKFEAGDVVYWGQENGSVLDFSSSGVNYLMRLIIQKDTPFYISN